MNLIFRKIINKLIKKKLKISVAESCTGGLFSSKITSISGSSKVFDLGLVTYSNKSKTNVLAIKKRIIPEITLVNCKISGRVLYS